MQWRADIAAKQSRAERKEENLKGNTVVKDSNRCLFNDSFDHFIGMDSNAILGILCDKYHGEALTTTREAWKSEIGVMQRALSAYSKENG